MWNVRFHSEFSTTFHWTSLYSGLHICHFRVHYGRSTQSLLATDPVSRNRCTKSVINDTFGAVPPGYFC
ncbi:hypothetical protein TNCT_63141 [Trichonephila clavata]|uniref:Uncharacterized protein n=1 Tax=Trichonephila clavata TaxID=2740835 RepID=A0A8X6KR87_TRICU|nr:hypothetical protein TNCT_63141 [Trichonephila clavata]